jgi:hypothetical protein
MRLRLGTRRGAGGQLYTRDEREEEEDAAYKKRKHQAGSLGGSAGSGSAMVGFTDLRKGQRKALQKLKRVA